MKVKVKQFLRKAVLFLLVMTLFFGFNTLDSSAATKILVTPSKKTLEMGKVVELKANKKVKWYVTKGYKYIKVMSKKDKLLKIKGTKAGNTTIKAKDAKTGKSKVIQIRVVPQLKIDLTSKTINVERTVTISSNRNVNWSISSGSTTVKCITKNKKIFKLKGLKSGTATIKAKDIKTGITKTLKITILPKLKISPSNLNLEVGDTVELKTNNDVNWSISIGGENVNFLSKKNKSAIVQGVKPGTATIKAKDKKTGFYKNIKITVTSKPKKSLVIYFSRGENIVNADEYLETLGEDIDAMTSASVLADDTGNVTGNNGIVSKWIAEALGTKTYSIHVKEPYPQLKKETQKIVLNYEQTNGILPEVEPCTENLEEYDIVYLGFPNWYGEPPRALYTFLKENNLDGKTIVPFTTHDKNGFSDAIYILKSMLPNSAVLEDGLVLHRKEVLDGKQATLEWLEKIRDVAENAKANPLATVAGQKEAAKKLIGQTLTKEEVAEAVGQYTKFVTDTNG